MLSDFVSLSSNAPRYIRQSLDVFSDHEKGRVQPVLGQNVENSFRLDGPAIETERILDILAEHRLHATFFMIGKHVERLPDIARRVAAQGHEIGKHSYSHCLFLFQSSRETQRQLERAQTSISGVTGVHPRFSRPPFGVRTRPYFAVTRSLGLRTVQWDVAGFDWKNRSAERVAFAVL